jgi:DNA-binding response OmpR family regulator
LIAHELSDRGFYVVIAYDGRVGLTAILKKIPDLVLCDIGLPEMSGLEILATLNGAMPRFNRIPFIFLTGRTSRHDEIRGRTLGADDYVTKPIDFDILEEIIRARLISGVVRHEILPKCFLTPPEVDFHRWSGPTSAEIGVGETIFELTGAPSVDMKQHQTRPIRSENPAEEWPKAGQGQIIKS